MWQKDIKSRFAYDLPNAYTQVWIHQPLLYWIKVVQSLKQVVKYLDEEAVLGIEEEVMSKGMCASA